MPDAQGRIGPLVAVALVGAALLSIPTAPRLTVGAQQVTPVAAPEIACNAPPRSADDILALLAPPPEGPPPVELAPPMPLGAPADPTTIDEISAAVQELEACLNTGDPLRFYALLSDNWFRDLRQTDDVRAELAALATTPPRSRDPGFRESFVGPWHVMTLEDQRVLAAVVWFGSEDDLRLDPRLTRIVIFVEHDGRWLIDEMIARVFVPECGHSVRAGAVVGPPPGATLAAPAQSCDDITHEDKEPSKERFAERQARAAGTTPFVPAAVSETVTLATPEAR